MTFFSCLEYGIVSFFHRQNIIQRRNRKELPKNLFDTKKKIFTSFESKHFESNLSSLLTRRNLKSSLSNYELKPSLIPILIDKNENIEEITKLSIDKYEHDYNIFDFKASKVDNCSRIMFPLIFFCFQVLYWSVYLSIYYST